MAELYSRATRPYADAVNRFLGRVEQEDHAMNIN